MANGEKIKQNMFSYVKCILVSLGKYTGTSSTVVNVTALRGKKLTIALYRQRFKNNTERISSIMNSLLYF